MALVGVDSSWTEVEFAFLNVIFHFSSGTPMFAFCWSFGPHCARQSHRVHEQDTSLVFSLLSFSLCLTNAHVRDLGWEGVLFSLHLTSQLPSIAFLHSDPVLVHWETFLSLVLKSQAHPLPLSQDLHSGLSPSLGHLCPLPKAGVTLSVSEL